MKFDVKVDLQSAITQAKRIQSALRRGRPDLLNQLGVQLLSLSQQAYRQKSRKQRGGDGITWSPLQRKTIENRVRRRGPAKRIVQQRRQLLGELQSLKAGGGKRGENRKAAMERVRAKRKELSVKLQQLISTEFAKYEIGRDTGLQLASASPGFAGPDGKGGNLLRVNGTSSVTVGYNRKYSKWFDAKRTLLPATPPPDWQKRLDNLTKKWADKIIKGAISGG